MGYISLMCPLIAVPSSPSRVLAARMLSNCYARELEEKEDIQLVVAEAF